jgi:hypothetical protein
MLRGIPPLPNPDLDLPHPLQELGSSEDQSSGEYHHDKAAERQVSPSSSVFFPRFIRGHEHFVRAREKCFPVCTVA